ncbi:tRNA(Ile)-lysidine synthase [Lacibacter cauensis]|uniref:tRNA(Ile)-lysidine synthase n=1 Tax=Lacibacter cauensis TaxID=510947 RepID=A0A562SHT8_9BACT|nr:tRNA lysidine(34) synthetase TilS [Lacibacter cauensis]TWI80504.1 tRNA(Ile)-lysidine synthase [Lacibacter cauensis]
MILSRFQQYIQQHNLFQPKDQLLLAVSGGVDSVVLVDLCAKSGYHFSIAHCNFQLRGEESEGDEQFVRSLGQKYNVEVLVKKFETAKYATEEKLSIQEAARVLRYEWFEELMFRQTPPSDELTENKFLSRPTGTSDGVAITHDSPLTTQVFTIHLLTAHHADDNNETLLMNFFRGTGLHGLTGIPVAYGHIKRPLLSFTKEELLNYAAANNLQYREDSSNQSSKYTRNFFRNELIPAIENVYPQVKQNLQDNIERFKSIEALYKLSTQQLIKKLCKEKGAEVHIPAKQLLQYHNRALIFEIIKPYGFTEKQIAEVEKLAVAETGKFITSPVLAFRIIKNRAWLVIAPAEDAGVGHVIVEGPGTIGFVLGLLEVKQTSVSNEQTPNSKLQIPNSNTEALLDAKHIEFPLLLRKWKTGDYFYPLGMKKKKKLARFFIDQKLSKTEKENVWVLESNKKIIWVVGHRIDDRFKLTNSTTTAVKLSLKTGMR